MTDRNPAEVLAEAARAAGLAPSVHNTQPWRWGVHPERLDLYADRARQLRAADPEGRLLTISCGAALHHARVAVAANGWSPVVERLPDPDRPDHTDRTDRPDHTDHPDHPDRPDHLAGPDHLARITLGAHVGVTAEAMRRFQTAGTRRTDRRPLTDTPVDPEALAAVRAAVEAEEAHLHLLRDEQVTELAVAAAQADDLAAGDEQLRAELAYWVGGDRPERTGLPDTSIPTQPPHTDVPLRDYGTSGTLPATGGGDRAASYGVIFGDQETPAGWLSAGEALSAGWLTAAEHGVALLPFSAPVEATATRTVLRRLLAGIGHPFLVVRLGLPDPHHPGPPHTPRLEPAQTVEYVTKDG